MYAINEASTALSYEVLDVKFLLHHITEIFSSRVFLHSTASGGACRDSLCIEFRIDPTDETSICLYVKLEEFVGYTSGPKPSVGGM